MTEPPGDVPPTPEPPARSARSTPLAPGAHTAGQTAGGIAGEAPLSKLAVASVVVSLLTCLPFALSGMALGAMSAARIRASRGRLRGMSLAMTAMLFGGVMMIAQLIAIEWARSELSAHYRASAQTLVLATFQAKEATAARQLLGDWSADPKHRVTAAAVQSFAESIEARYGGCRSIEVIASEPSSSDPHALMTTAVIFDFERSQRPGSVRTVLVPTTAAFMPAAKLVEIIVEDREHGELRLGGEVSPLPAAAGETGKERSDG
ncbi:MAG: hypothetical protein SGJ11_13585 [Phycisphaerae bacterium]|nr:hypothetical protein [Phycisphaerae bacterium]